MKEKNDTCECTNCTCGTEKEEIVAISKPLSREEVEARLGDDNEIEEVVAIAFNTVINSNFEDLMDIFEGLLLEEGILSNIGYKLVGTINDAVLVRVTGDVVF